MTQVQDMESVSFPNDSPFHAEGYTDSYHRGHIEKNRQFASDSLSGVQSTIKASFYKPRKENQTLIFNSRLYV